MRLSLAEPAENAKKDEINLWTDFMPLAGRK